MDWFGADGSLGTVGLTLLVLGGSLAVERLAVALRARAWFSFTLPLHVELLPIAEPPAGDGGQAGGLTWQRMEDGVIVWWASRAGGIPAGLHGVAYLARSRGGVHVQVRWAPPMTPLVGAMWLAVLGAARREAELSGPLAALLVLAIMLVYQRAAVQASRVLRWALAEATSSSSGRDGEGRSEPS